MDSEERGKQLILPHAEELQCPTGQDPTPQLLGVEKDRTVSHPSSPHSAQPMRCIIHTGGTGALQPMKDHIWQAIKTAAAARKTKARFESSKYYTIIKSMPEEPDDAAYHVQCHKNFTAISSEVATSLSIPPSKMLRKSRSATSSASFIFPQDCIFCGKKKIQKGKNSKVEMLGSCKTLEAAENIRRAALAIQDHEFLKKIDVDLVANEAKYHHSCKSKYLKKADRINITRVPKCTKIALQETYTYVETNIIEGNRSELLTSIYSRYAELCAEADEMPVTTSQYLSQLLLSKFSDRLELLSPKAKKRGVIVCNSQLIDESVRVTFDYRDSAESAITKTALVLRKHLKEVKPVPTSNDQASSIGLDKGDASPPELVRTFFRILFGGLNLAKHSDEVLHRADSASQDALFMTTNGAIWPRKHIAMGIGVKSMTGSRKLVTMLNRLGHSINYKCAEELEAKIALVQQGRDQASPEGTWQNAPMGLAFDNYDEICCTFSGANTLHDTMYQAVDTSQPLVDFERSRPPTSSCGNKRKKRKMDVPETVPTPYCRKLRMVNFQPCSPDNERSINHIEIGRRRDS
uniref:uncharacterized protein n=1 Tax=Myxine glutinosa TaxID=7769 RepID=UPI00358E4ECA